ncbi:hypothetical protein ORV05_27745 [Amycolatopsis cynarae]|uniref:7-cyano-7-deazaguanine synthase n=1 Tax=Amycolatopsis cynarae TaxID=2995223 RepID=A0ABY7B0C8_9PSEU|nr:hypothetical protein [Amycolatopsis sp. HUAS 11-8]WAL64723.1 hypothetical protein ORV05_27745 [Amycolatopsis sp. HUAS 11-8]
MTEGDFRSTLTRVRSAVQLASDSTPIWAEDLLTLARAVFLADKRALRARAADRWTRDIELVVQIIEPGFWYGEPLSLLNRVLQVMTGDRWLVSVRAGARPIDGQQRAFAGWRAEEAALFSGGLDSGAYAARRVRDGTRRLLLIGHDHARGSVPQIELCHHIDAIRPGAVRLARVRDEPRKVDGGLEPSTRSRGFLFAATAVYAASAHRLQVVAMPENGQVALNPPLTPGRIGANSTRSAHPWVLAEINRLIAVVGGEIRIENPYLGLTKGEVCEQATTAGLSPDALARTVSCGHPPAVRGRFGNCGYCFPCLVRRSGLRAALGQDPTDYSRTLTELDTPAMVQHVSDLWQWISRPFTVRDLIVDMPLPDHVSPRALMPVLDRGRREIDDMLDDAGFPPTGYRPEAVPDQAPGGKHIGTLSRPHR